MGGGDMRKFGMEDVWEMGWGELDMEWGVGGGKINSGKLLWGGVDNGWERFFVGEWGNGGKEVWGGRVGEDGMGDVKFVGREGFW